MAAPTAPTADSIVTEGMKKAKYGSARITSDKTRAKDEWLEEVKNEIWLMNKEFMTLLKFAITVTQKGQAQYDNPSDFSSVHTIWRLYGNTTGTAQDGSTSTIQLASTNTKDPVGFEILITSGTGIKSIGRAVTYNSTTKWVDVVPQFNSAPSSGSGYMIVEDYKELDRELIERRFDRSLSTNLGDPDYYFMTGDESYGKMILSEVPDKVYGIRNYYYANLLKADLASTTLATAYERWRSLFVQGIYYKALEARRDNDANREKAEFYRQLGVMIAKEKPEHQNSDLQVRIGSEYP